MLGKARAGEHRQCHGMQHRTRAGKQAEVAFTTRGIMKGKARQGPAKYTGEDHIRGQVKDQGNYSNASKGQARTQHNVHTTNNTQDRQDN